MLRAVLFFSLILISLTSHSKKSVDLSVISQDLLPNHAVVLQYHHVDASTPPITSVTPEVFESHLQLLEQEGFNVQPLPWVMEQIRSHKPLPKKTVVITFDDGYLSIYTQAFPLLKKRNWPFTIFVSPKPIDEQWSESLSWEQLREMQKAGATIANHSMDHLHMLNKLNNESAQQWRSRIEENILSAQQRIDQETGKNNRLFAYPYGEFDWALMLILKEMDYIAFGQQSGPIGEYSDMQALPRFPASGIYANTQTLKSKLYTLPFRIFGNNPGYQIQKKNLAPELTLTVAASDIGINQIQCFFSGAVIPTEKTLLNASDNRKELIIRTRAESTLPVGRSRYNCTAPSRSSKYYYWYSHPWLVQGNDRSSEQEG